jgi:N-acetylglucosamine-6-phosphate deacetylase
MSRLLFTNCRILLEAELIEQAFLFINNGKIESFGKMSELPTFHSPLQVLELSQEHTIVPGFIDVHIHGAGGADTMDSTPDALTTMASVLPSEGTTAFLATTITQEKQKINQALQNVALYREQHNTPGKAEVIGVHLEGPFINEKRAGAQPPSDIIHPDVLLFQEWQLISGGAIKLVTLAPEKEKGLELVKYLSETGVIASIGHSDATYYEVEEAVQAGASQVTHLFNGMRGLHHREPGVAGAALLLDELKVEMIADGIHVRPEMIKLALQAKGMDGMLLITDSMRAKCLKNG